MKNQSGIYEIVNTANGKRYIGSAKNFRRRRVVHVSLLNAGKHHSQHLQSAWSSYGSSSFVFRPMLLCSVEDLIFFEQRAIDSFRPEYNVSPTAGSTLGKACSPETRRKIGDKARGRKWSDESKRKVSATLTGRKMGEEFSAKLRGNKHAEGHKHTEEWKAASAARNRARTYPPKSPEWRARIAASLTGRKATPEARANQSRAQLGKKRGPYKLKVKP